MIFAAGQDQNLFYFSLITGWLPWTCVPQQLAHTSAKSHVQLDKEQKNLPVKKNHVPTAYAIIVILQEFLTCLTWKKNYKSFIHSNILSWALKQTSEG